MATAARKIFSIGVGVLTFLVIRKPSKQQLRRARRDAMYAAYDEAGTDPEFVAAMRELETDFDSTVSDGLEEFTG
jgi:hypothetical protein